MQILFRESQRFTQWWLWLLMIGLGAIPVFGIYQQLILKKPFGDNPMSDNGLVVFALGIAALLWLFFALRLETTITSEQIQIRYFPFFNRTCKWADIESAKLVNYGFVGYGIRYGSPYGVIYNVKGSVGLAIRLKTGKAFVIGTQQNTELEKIIRNCLPDKAV